MIVVMAPLVVRLVKNIPVAWMIGFGFSILACAMWFYASFNLATNYGHESLAEWCRALGWRFFLCRRASLPIPIWRKIKTTRHRA